MRVFKISLQTTINDIQQQMNEHYQKNSSLREENQGLANNLKELCEKYEIREQVCKWLKCQTSPGIKYATIEEHLSLLYYI